MPSASKSQTVDRRVSAEPTKGFFIEMLTKDVALSDAIADLVDNSVDAARAIRPNKEFEGLHVRIAFDTEHFRIEDNCGGIPIDVARKYAFRFGRPTDVEAIPYSIGRFGVGMKRALFKLGRWFRVDSRTRKERFVLEVDVADWQEPERKWEFRFNEIDEDAPTVPEDKRGTTILVRQLIPGVSDEFGLDNFKTALVKGLELAHQFALAHGFEITINATKLKPKALRLLVADELKPALYRAKLDGTGGPPVSVTLYAGIDESKPDEAGWDVFCNDRLVLGADQTRVTGWSGRGGVPKFHNQYARFRGYAFFEAEDPAKLPWNTTKTGIDHDSPLYQAIQQQMIGLMKPVVTFLNQLDAEGDRGRLHDAVESAKPTALTRITHVGAFEAPARPKSKAPRTRRIQYDKPTDQVERVMRELDVTTLTAVGEKTFDYYYDLECAE